MSDHTPDALRPPPGNPRFPLVDGLRAIAALSIVAFHAGGATFYTLSHPFGGYVARLNVGVTLFFVISGFLLYRPYLAARFGGPPAPRMRDYARRRVLRILPAYWVALVVLGVAADLSFNGHVWVYAFLLQGYRLNWVLGGIGPAWSLSIEVAFYVALPFFALALARLERGRPRAAMIRIEAAGLALVYAGALAVRMLAFHAAGGQAAVHTTLLGTADWFAGGMALALASVVWQGRERSWAPARIVIDRPWLPWALAAVLFFVVATRLGIQNGFIPVYTGPQWLAQEVLFGLIGVLVALPAVFTGERRGLVRGLLGHPVAAWLGLISYGIFLWHDPVLVEWIRPHTIGWSHPFFGTLAVLVPVSIAFGAASYYVVERPALRFKERRPARRAARPSAD